MKFILNSLLLISLTASIVQAGEIHSPREYDPAGAMYDRATYFYDKGLYLAAAKQFDRCARQFPNHPLTVQAETQVGVCYVQLQRYREADVIFDRLWEKRPWLEHPLVMNDLYLNWIKTRISLGDIETAQKLYSAFTMSEPNKYFLSEATFLIAEHFYLNDQRQLATAYLNHQQIFGTSRAYALHLLAIMALEDGRDELAVSYFEDLLDFEINMRYRLEEIAMLQDIARYKLALLYYERLMYDQALFYYYAIENHDLYGGDKALGSAWCYFQLDRYDLAQEQLDLIFADYEDYHSISEAYFLTGVVSMQTQEFGRSIAAFKEFLAIFGAYTTEEPILQREQELHDELEAIAILRHDLIDLEARLVDLPDEQAIRFGDLIEDKRQQFNDDLAGVQRMLNSLKQRRYELPLQVEAEYGLAKAQLQMNLVKQDTNATPEDIPNE